MCALFYCIMCKQNETGELLGSNLCSIASARQYTQYSNRSNLKLHASNKVINMTHIVLHM